MGEEKRDGQILSSNMYFERFRFVLRYDIIVPLSNRDPATGGGELLWVLGLLFLSLLRQV